jgi:hypothetical protein
MNPLRAGTPLLAHQVRLDGPEYDASNREHRHHPERNTKGAMRGGTGRGFGATPPLSARWQSLARTKLAELDALAKRVEK